MEGLKLFGHEIKLIAFADDVTYFCKSNIFRGIVLFNEVISEGIFIESEHGKIISFWYWFPERSAGGILWV